MTITEAITKANAIRPNKMPDEQKYDAVMKLEGQVAELMAQEQPIRNYPDGKANTLLMPYPNDNIYVLYLAAIIDYYNQELDKYQNDSVIFEEAKQKAFSKYRRENVPNEYSDGFKVM